MRKAIFIGFILLGVALGLFSTMRESIGVQIAMVTIGVVAGIAVGGALSRIGLHRRTMHVSSTDEATGVPGDRISNYWLDHGRLTAAPGLPDPDETDQISLKP